MSKVFRQPREKRINLIRLSVGFTVSAVACAIPWVALTSVILPAVLENINAAGKESMLGTINAVGSVVALLANVVFGTFSDLTRSRFGKRTPWIILGGLIAGGAMALLALNQNSFPMILLLWCTAQLGYNVMLAPFVATMSDRIPDEVRGTISGFYGAGIAAGSWVLQFLPLSALSPSSSGHVKAIIGANLMRASQQSASSNPSARQRTLLISTTHLLAAP